MGLSFQNNRMECINIPIELLTKYKNTKERKELLAFAIGIKCLHRNSVLLDVSIKKVMTLFHVSNGKAKRLLNDAKNSELFTYSVEHNQLRVNSFKDKTIKTARNGLKYTSDYCYKLEKKPYTIAELCRTINEVLVEYAINAVDRDNFPKGGTRYGSNKALTQKKLGNIAGISRSSVQRLTKRLADGGIIRKTRATMKMVISKVNEYTLSAWQRISGLKRVIVNPHDGSGWIVKPCEYSILNRRITDRFQHVIYDHRSRITSFHPSECVNPMFNH